MPISESATEHTDTGKRPHPTDPRRWADGTQRPKVDSIARKYPKPAPAVQLQADRRNDIITQRGGRERLSPMQLGEIDRFVILEAFVLTWETYFMEDGPYTRQGRVRSGYREGYLASLDRLMKLGQQIGVEPMPKDVESLDDFLDRIAAEEDDNAAVQTSAKGEEDREP